MHLLAIAALSDPTRQFVRPHSAIDPDGYKAYVCHAAVLHWSLRALGKDNLEAEKILAEYMYLRHGNQIPVEPWDFYGPVFTSKCNFVPLPDDQLAQNCSVGDVVIIGPPNIPAHSMVVVSVANQKVLVRGYNNFGTFAEAALNSVPRIPYPPSNAYDAFNRDLSTRSVSQGPVPMYRTTATAFTQRVKHVMTKYLKTEF